MAEDRSAATPNERSTDALHMQDDGAGRVLPVPSQEVASAAIKRLPVKRPRISWVCYRDGGQRGPLVYFKRPGIMRLQGRRRGIVVYWLGWL